MPLVAAAIGGSALLGVAGAKSSANAANRASQRDIAEQRRQFDITQQNMTPWLEAGRLGLGRLSDLVRGDMSGFQMDPGYQFALEQGTQAIDRGAAARGMLGSGARLKDLTRFGQGLANQQYSDYWNRLAGLSNVGQTTGTSLGQFGANMAGRIGQAHQEAGAARASGYQGMTNALQGGINNALFYNMMNPSSATVGGGSFGSGTIGF